MPKLLTPKNVIIFIAICVAIGLTVFFIVKREHFGDDLPCNRCGACRDSNKCKKLGPKEWNWDLFDNEGDSYCRPFNRFSYCREDCDYDCNKGKFDPTQNCCKFRA